jgi:DNA-binding MarR family transcriptional regulator
MKLEDELKMKFASAKARAGLNVIFTGAWLSERFNQLLKPFGISEQQYNVLRILRGQKGKPANLFTIQERMVHRMSNATRLVEKLRLKGYVERQICEENRRKIEVTITQKGLDLIDEIEPKAVVSNKKLHSRMTKQEAELLGDVLDRIRG